MIRTSAQLGLDMTLTLKQALLVYEERAPSMGFSGGRGFATVHDIGGDGASEEATALGPGRLLTYGDLRELVRKISGNQGLRYLPPHILAHSPDGLAWWSEAQKRPLFFQTQDDYLNGLSGQLFPQPPLLFIARERGLSVFALPENKRPTADTPLCYAPYYNVYESGTICLGSMPLPATLEPEDTERYEGGFFHSNFTHPSGSRLFQTWPDSYGELWSNAQLVGTYPNKTLVPIERTVKEVLSL